MKKVRCPAALLYVLLFLPARSLGEPTESAETVAAQVQAFYDHTKTVSAHFAQTFYHKLYGRYDRASGEVFFKKPGEMRWDYARPNGKRIVSNGERLSVFEPGEDGEPGQIFEQSVDENQLPLAFSFLVGRGRLDQDFTFRLLPQSFQGGHVLELRPKKATPYYDRVLFYVGEGKTRGVLHRVLIVDEAGNRNRFDFSELRFNRPLADSLFRFKAPPGTRRVRP